MESVESFAKLAGQFGWAVALLAILVFAIGVWIWKWLLPRMDRIEARAAQQGELHRQELKDMVILRAADNREMLTRFAEIGHEVADGFKETARSFQQVSTTLDKLSEKIDRRTQRHT